MVNDLSLLLKVLAHMQNRAFVKRSIKSDLSGSTLRILLKINLKDSSLYVITIFNHNIEVHAEGSQFIIDYYN